ncbi:MAG TPA: ABC transporter permease [Candidatus Methylomirabilis sp.]|nr:ABC transporter permease [Candidatus Methylomirabilis sp.]
MAGLLMLAVWEGAWRAGWIDPLFFSGPTAVAGALWRLVVSGAIIPNYLTTLSAAALGLVLAVATGGVAGIVYGLSPAVRQVAGPYLAALNATPRVATIGLLVVWLGLGIGVRVALVTISAFFPVFFNTAEGVRGRDASLDRVARVYGCNRREWFTSILLPHTLPYLLTGTRLALGRALVVVVIAEIFVGSLGGIGYFIINAGQQFQSANVLAAACLMAATGWALSTGLERLGIWLTPWHDGR